MLGMILGNKLKRTVYMQKERLSTSDKIKVLSRLIRKIFDRGIFSCSLKSLPSPAPVS